MTAPQVRKNQCMMGGSMEVALKGRSVAVGR